MKVTSRVAYLAILMINLVSAGIDIPRHVYQLRDLEKAQLEAEEKGKALAFVYSQQRTTCGLCVNASEKAFKELKSHAVVVFVDMDDKEKFTKLRPPVVTGLLNEKAGNTIPIVSINSPDMLELWHQMSYDLLKSDRNFREARKFIRQIVEEEREPIDLSDALIIWPTKGDGRFYTGKFQALQEQHDIVLLKGKDGQPVRAGMKKLTDSSLAYARSLAGNGKKEGLVDLGGLPEIESWTGSNGKVIQAKFLSLSDEGVELETEEGKTYTLPLSRLSAESQKRAKELGS